MGFLLVDADEDCVVIEEIELDVPAIAPQDVNFHGRVSMVGTGRMMVAVAPVDDAGDVGGRDIAGRQLILHVNPVSDLMLKGSFS